MRISQVMVKKVWSCRPEDTLSQAASLMWDHDVGCIPVVDEAGCPVAMITDRDICMSGHLSGRSSSATSVRDAMSKRMVTVAPEQRTEEAEALMREAQVRRLPVVDAAGKLVGIVSLVDLARALPRTSVNGVEQTLSAIAEPRLPVARPNQSIMLRA